MPYVIQMEENTNYEDTDVTIPCSLTIEDGETNIGTETNKCLQLDHCHVFLPSPSPFSCLYVIISEVFYH
jgi:hypothetical protein